MLGLMQDWPLTVDRILDHAKTWHGDREIVSRSIEGPIVRTTYAQIHARAKRVSSALLALGVQPGERIATMAWNSGRHLEAWYGIMGIGAVCHTLNPRLFAEQICYIINHAEDRILLADLTFLPLLHENRARMPKVEHVIALTDAEHMETCGYPGAVCYETLLEQAAPDAPWGGFEENTACGLCYTSGTTGNPKGVLYSHRSNFLHTLVALQTDALGLSNQDTVMPIVPMYHANAWGLTFAAPAVGAKLVMPGAQLDGAALYEMLEGEGVTMAGAVPTLWQGLLTHLEATGARLSTLKRVLTGGSACPEALMRGLNERGIEVLHAWGMTESSPMATHATPSHAVTTLPAEEQVRFRLKQGRASVAVELKLADDDGQRLPHDGKTFGRLMMRGPYVVDRYYRGEGGDILDADHYFDTGDIATIDGYGYVQLTDRAKDVIKSGGEWISSIEIENLAVGHPKAALAAVIGIAHPKWDERPLLLIKLKDSQTATAAEILAFLEGKIAKWWMPDQVLFVDDIPLGATGKIDKKRIREAYAGYRLQTGS